MKKILYLLTAACFLYFAMPRGGTYFYLTDTRWLYILILSFLTTSVLMPLVIHLGNKLNILDMPSDRKVHSIPVPLTGGIAVGLAFFIVMFRNLNFSSAMRGIMMSSFIMLLTGILDDIYDVPSTIRIIVQLIASTILVFYGIRVSVFPYSLGIFKHILDISVTYIGVLGITNAFIYMDGMNGEAGGLTVVTGFTLFAVSYLNGAKHISWLAIGLVGCALGFLPFNYPKSKVFLGDSGSTFIGFLLAAIAIAGSWNAVNPAVAVITPLLIFSLYIFDMSYTTVSRIKNGSVRTVKQWFAVTGKDHFHHRLVKLGFSKEFAVIIIWISAAVFSFSSFVIRRAEGYIAVLIIFQCVFIYFLIIILMLAGRQLDGDPKPDARV